MWTEAVSANKKVRFQMKTDTCRRGLKRQTSQLHIIFMEELSFVLTKDFVSCVHVRFYFFTAAHFHLAGR